MRASLRLSMRCAGLVAAVALVGCREDPEPVPARMETVSSVARAADSRLAYGQSLTLYVAADRLPGRFATTLSGVSGGR